MRATLQYWFDRSFTSAEARKIDAEYQLSLVAENTREIVEVQRRMFESQALVADRIAEDSLRPAPEWLTVEVEGKRGVPVSALVEMGFEIRKQRPHLRQSLADMTDDLAMAAHSLWRIEEMLRQPLRTAIDQETRRAHDLLRQGSNLLDGQRRAHLFAEAQRTLEAAFSEDPSAYGCFLLGWVFWRHREDFRAAERCFERAGVTAKEQDFVLSVLAFRHQANMLYKIGRYAEARAAVEAACEANPTDADAWFEQARYASRAGDREGCEKALQTAISLRPILRLTLLSEPDFFV